MTTTQITASTSSTNPLSSLNPDSPLGYFRTFLTGRDAADFQAEADSLIDALQDAEGYSEEQVELAGRVLERIANFS